MCVSDSITVLGTRMSCAKNSIEMPFGDAVWGADLCEPKEPCVRWGQDRTNPFAAARGDKTPNYFGHLLVIPKPRACPFEN